MSATKDSTDSPTVGIVGVCASGKSTISRLLQARGINCRPIAQEHSYVPTMWLQLTHPDFLVFLQASYPITIKRKNLNWTQSEYDEEIHRLQHACANADMIINTDNKNPNEIADLITTALQQAGIISEILSD